MGSLRNLGRENKKPEEAPQKTDLMSRIEELRMQLGKGWEEISEIVRSEGLGGAGESLTANALRKRFNRWLKTQQVSTTVPSESLPEPAEQGLVPAPSVHPVQEQILAEMRTLTTEMGFIRERLAAIDTAVAVVPEPTIADPMQELIGLNNQLMDQVLESYRMMERLERRIEEQVAIIDHTGIEDEDQVVTSRDLLELLKEITSRRDQQMRYIEENKQYPSSREEILALLDEKVEEKVDTAPTPMLAEGGSFSAELTRLVDQRLKNLFSPAEPVAQSPHAGPGRGRKGKTHKKFSASLEESLFERVKSLPGQFSGHLSNALDAYLSVMEKKKSD